MNWKCSYKILSIREHNVEPGDHRRQSDWNDTSFPYRFVFHKTKSEKSQNRNKEYNQSNALLQRWAERRRASACFGVFVSKTKRQKKREKESYINFRFVFVSVFVVVVVVDLRLRPLADLTACLRKWHFDLLAYWKIFKNFMRIQRKYCNLWWEERRELNGDDSNAQYVIIIIGSAWLSHRESASESCEFI